MRILSIIVVAVVAGIGLVGCASNSQPVAHSLGLTSGPLPSPQPFVVDSRGAQSALYPAVGVTPPARIDRVLSMSERKTLEASLLATPGRQPSDAEKKAKAKAARKPVPIAGSKRKHVGFFPPQ